MHVLADHITELPICSSCRTVATTPRMAASGKRSRTPATSDSAAATNVALTIWLQLQNRDPSRCSWTTRPSLLESRVAASSQICAYTARGWSYGCVRPYYLLSCGDPFFPCFCSGALMMWSCWLTPGHIVSPEGAGPREPLSQAALVRVLDGCFLGTVSD